MYELFKSQSKIFAASNNKKYIHEVIYMCDSSLYLFNSVIAGCAINGLIKLFCIPQELVPWKFKVNKIGFPNLALIAGVNQYWELIIRISMAQEVLNRIRHQTPFISEPTVQELDM